MNISDDLIRRIVIGLTSEKAAQELIDLILNSFVSPEGPQGIQGIQGIQGVIGPVGQQGIQGPEGPQGVKGDRGEPFTIAKIYATTTDLQQDTNPDVAIGQFSVVTSHGDLYIWDGTQWLFVTTLTGSQGIEGPQGIQGPQGVQGPIGATGPQGEQGSIGPQGIQGIQGIPGPVFNTGVVEGDYGSSSDVATFSVNSKGQLTNAASLPIQIQESQVTGLALSLGTKADKTTSLTAGTGLSGGGDFSANRTISMPNVGTPATYGSASHTSVITTDAQGRVSSASSSLIQITSSQVSDFSSSVNSVITSAFAAKHSLIGYKVFTTAGAGTYTPTAGTNYIDAILVGAGGGGGGAAGVSSNSSAGAGGGAGGMIRIFVPLTGAASYSYVIGGGGVGGTSSGGNGNNGGGSSLTIGANTFAASTGTGGKGMAAGTAPELSAGGNGANVIATPISGTFLNLPGEDGQVGLRVSGSIAVPGMGARGWFGSGGAITAGGGNGANGGGYGSGGGGGYAQTNAGKSGGNGAPGILIIAEYA